jgi:hypothetical protein
LRSQRTTFKVSCFFFYNVLESALIGTTLQRF